MHIAILLKAPWQKHFTLQHFSRGNSWGTEPKGTTARLQGEGSGAPFPCDLRRETHTHTHTYVYLFKRTPTHTRTQDQPIVDYRPWARRAVQISLGTHRLRSVQSEEMNNWQLTPDFGALWFTFFWERENNNTNMAMRATNFHWKMIK